MALDGWIVVLCATVLSTVIGWLTWQTSQPVYQSTITLFVVTPGPAAPLDAYHGDLNSLASTATYEQLARSSKVTGRTIDKLGLSQTPGELAGRITVVPTTTALIGVTVTDTDPDRTRETANVLGASMVDLSREMADKDNSGTELVMVGDAGPAVRQGTMWRSMFTGAALGLGISVLLVLAHGTIRDSVRTRGQVGHVVDEMLGERA
jgi:capsular polysaccharide biosynthesis protein